MLDPLGPADAATLHEVALLTRGFSGREVSKLFTSLQTHICAAEKDGSIVKRNLSLMKQSMVDVVKMKVEEHLRTEHVKEQGYEYVNLEPGHSRSSSRGSKNGEQTSSFEAVDLDQESKSNCNSGGSPKRNKSSAKE